MDDDSDEGLDLPITMQHDVENAEKQAEGVIDRANKIRDDLNPQQREGSNEGVGSDVLLEKIQELRERLQERRPMAWRADRGSPTGGMLSDDAEDGRITPPVVPTGPTTAELEVALCTLTGKKPSSPPQSPNAATDVSMLKAEITDLKGKLDKACSPTAATTAELRQKLHERDDEIASLSNHVAEVQEDIRKEFKTGLKALRMENEDLQKEREELERQIISLKLDKEEAEHRFESLRSEGQQSADEIREEVKKAERARITTAAAQMKKELELRNQKKIAEVESQLRAEAEAERLTLENRIRQLEAEQGASHHGHMVESKLQALQATNMREKRERRRLQNKLGELTGAVRVLCRVRPVLAAEIGEGSRCVISFPEPNTIALSDSGENYHTFEFTKVFEPEAAQAEVSAEVTPSVVAALDGFHYALVTHGQQGAGKTYSMTGVGDEEGAAVHAVRQMFADVVEREKKNWRYSYKVSVGVVGAGGGRDLLEGTEVENLSDCTQREGDMECILAAVKEAAQVPPTEHSVCTIYVEGRNDQLCFSSSSRVHLIDLGDASTLDVSILTKPGPSLLSAVFQDLRTNGATVSLLSCVSPCLKDVSSTLSALSFASKASEVEYGKPKKNVTRYRS